MNRVDVLDKGYVRLVDVMGSDLSVVNAARASFARESREFDERDERLIRFLAREGHTSPFRHAMATFEVKAPLMVARQWWKYVVGSDHTMDGWNEACLPGHQTVKAWSGRTYTVEQLYKLSKRQRNYLPYLRSVNDRGEVVRNKVAAVWETGVADVYRVTSDNGFVIEATANHRFLTPDGYKMLSELSPGDLVMMNGEPAYKNKEWLRQKYMVAHPVPIKSIEHVGRLKVYDIEMQHEPNLVVNQYIVHNSRRYITMEPEFYVPEFWRQAPENKKQGSGGPVSMELTEAFNRKLEEVIELGMRYYREALDAGIAPEQARLLLPAYGMYTVWRWSASLQSICHFLNQRLSSDAQWEIREYAKAVERLIRPRFPVSVAALLGEFD